jgi:elongation factor G
MDRSGADFLNCVGQIAERLKANPVPLQLPIGAEADFVGVIDLIAMKANIYDEKSVSGEKFDVVDIPEHCKELADEYREKLLEAAADIDDAIMGKFLAGEESSKEDIAKAIRKGALDLKITPIFCGAAFKNKGVQQLLDAVITFLPSPLDVPPIQGTHPDTNKEITRKSESGEPLSALAFKIMTDPFVGQLAFVRVYSGALLAHVD